MKALYCMWPDFGYIDQAVNTGAVDTLLIAFYSHPWAPAPATFDSWETSVSVLERYKGKVKLIACPVTMEKWMPVDAGHRFKFGGVEDLYTFCPTSEFWMGKIFAPFKDLQNKGMCDGIIYDVENYPKGPALFQNQIACECDRCRSKFPSQESQWAYRRSVMQKDNFNMGQFIYNNPWSMQCYNNALYLTEDTYGKKDKCDGFKWRWANDKLAKKGNYTIVPGVFLEAYKSTDDFLTQLKYWQKHYGSWWIYSQHMLSRNSKMTEEGMKELEGGFGYYERRLMADVDGNFFNKLKSI